MNRGMVRGERERSGGRGWAEGEEEVMGEEGEELWERARDRVHDPRSPL